MKNLLKKINGACVLTAVILGIMILLGHFVEWIIASKIRIAIFAIVALGLAIKWIRSGMDE